MEIEQGDIVLCTVDRIAGTTVFVKIEETGEEGSIILPEIAPGRIRNLREYVVPKKKIVCKILKKENDRIELSLRRVTLKEKKEVLEQEKIEKGQIGILKSILGEKTKEIVDKIKENQKVSEFLSEAKENSKTLEKLVGKENSEKIISILKTQKSKTIFLKKNIEMKTNSPNGVSIIKEILGKIKDANIKYIAAGKYSIEVEEEDLKKADSKLKEIVIEIEKNSKGKNVEIKSPFIK